MYSARVEASSGQRRASILTKLEEGFARVAGGGAEAFRARARSVLGLEQGAEPPVGSSTLTNDGTPIQLCIHCRGGAPAARLVVDPAYAVAPPARRLAAAFSRLDEAATPAGATALATELRAVIRPRDEADGARRRGGALWLAFGRGPRGLAAYGDAEPVGWSAVDAWLPRGATAAALAGAEARARLRPASLGFEVGADGPPRRKVYLRFARPVRLEESPFPELAEGPFRGLLDVVFPDGRARGSGLLPSVAVDAEGLGRTDTKLDVCLCARCAPGRDGEKLLEMLEDRLAVSTATAREVLRALGLRVVVLGVAVDGEGRVRLNVYCAGPQPWTP